MRSYKPILLWVLMIHFSLPSLSQLVFRSSTQSFEGMVVNTFSSGEGDVTVYLPSDMTSGSEIQGTVSTTPKGKNERERKVNLEKLLAYSIKMGQETISLSGSVPLFSLNPASVKNAGSAALELVDPRGNTVSAIPALLLPPVHPVPGSLSHTIFTPIITDQRILLQNPLDKKMMHSNFSFSINDELGTVMKLEPVCKSATGTLLLIPPNLKPGSFRLVIRNSMTEDQEIIFHRVNLEMNAPSTMLRKGESTTLTLKVTGLGDLNEEGIRLRMMNMTPSIVKIEQGEIQEWPVRTSNDEISFTRSVMALDNGSFKVNASLQLPATSFSDPFHIQKKGIRTPGEYNSWISSLKKDLRAYADKQGDNEVGRAVRANVQRAIDALPACSGASNLTQCLETADVLLRPIQVPAAAANFFNSFFELFRSMFTSVKDPEVLRPVEWDLVQGGLVYMEHFGRYNKDDKLVAAAGLTQSLIQEMEDLQGAGAEKNGILLLTKNLSEEVENRMRVNHELGKSFRDFMFSASQFNLVNSLSTSSSEQETDKEQNIIGFLDPEEKKLFTAPGFRIPVLDMVNARPLSGNNYVIKTVSLVRTPVTYEVEVVDMSPALLYRHAQSRVTALVCNYSSGSEAGELIKEDSIKGTAYRFYKNAKCKIVYQGRKNDECLKEMTFKWTREGELVEEHTGKYYKWETYDRWECRKGTDFCTEMLVVNYLDHIYDDENCKRLIRVKSTLNFSCQ